MYYRWTSPEHKSPWKRISYKNFSNSEMLQIAYKSNQVEIKEEKVSPKQRQAQLIFVRNGKIHLVLGAIRNLTLAKDITFTQEEKWELNDIKLTLQRKLS